MDLFLENYKKSSSLFKTKSLFLQSLIESGKKIKDTSKLRILVLNSPCYGFGDVVFAMKLFNYLKDWYKCTVKIATTQPENFLKLGTQRKDIYDLKAKGKPQCKTFRVVEFFDKNTNMHLNVPYFDLIFVAPVTIDFTPDLGEIRSLIPYANRLNTFFLSEYNDTLKKEFDFHTGVGEGYDGMFFTYKKGDKKPKKLKGLPNPYSVMYLSKETTEVRLNACVKSFIKMVTDYKKNHVKVFDIVCPDWLVDRLRDDNDLYSFINPIFANIEFVKKDETFIYDEEVSGKTLRFRGDILPLPYDEIQRLYIHSTELILITGDQSLTDVLSCCHSNKYPFYQIMPWKSHLANEMMKNLPQKYMGNFRTSCGTMKAIKTKPNFNKFVKKWDFRNLAKPKMDAIVYQAMTKDKDVQEIRDIILNSRTIGSVKNKISEM